MTKRMMALMALTLLTACDASHKADVKREHDDRQYRKAMSDYQAGQLDDAITGFEKAVRGDPGNSSARFQLGCLLQDLKHDYVGAYGCYREYLVQQPDSDKAKLARERLDVCEQEVAKALATKYGLTSGTDAAVAELTEAKKSLKKAESRVAELEKNLRESLVRVRTLAAERDRLLDVVKGVGSAEPETTTKASIVREAKALLEEDEDDVAGPQVNADEKAAVKNEKDDGSGNLKAIAGEKSVIKAENDEDTSRLRNIASEAAALKAEGDADEASSSELLPKQPSRAAAKPVVKKAESKPKVPIRPKTHVVAEGETLYGVAKRYYGSVSAWKAIKAANKALISADNRLHVGDTIVLP